MKKIILVMSVYFCTSAMATDRAFLPQFLCVLTTQEGIKQKVLIYSSPSDADFGETIMYNIRVFKEETKLQLFEEGILKVSSAGTYAEDYFTGIIVDAKYPEMDRMYGMTWYRNDKHSFHATFYADMNDWLGKNPLTASIYIEKRTGKGKIKLDFVRERNLLGKDVVDNNSATLEFCHEIARVSIYPEIDLSMDDILQKERREVDQSKRESSAPSGKTMESNTITVQTGETTTFKTQ